MTALPSVLKYVFSRLVGKRQQFSVPLLICTTLLLLFGILALYSAALGKLGSGNLFWITMITQIIGILIGGVCIYAATHYKQLDYRKIYSQGWTLYLFVAAILLQLLVFSPIGIERKGATRWLDLGPVTIQPSEFLKIALVLLFASLLVSFKKEIRNLKTLVLLLAATCGMVGAIMLLIRDKGTLMVLGITTIIMLFASSARIWHVLLLIAIAASGLGALVFGLDSESYARQRIETFLGMNNDTLGAGYQVDQAIMTVGSGGIFGKGYGQSIQKHGLLPETLNDSIFAIIAEELGFVGSVLLLGLFTSFILIGISIAQKASNQYGYFLALGLTSLIGTQAFINIMAMIKLFPLSGMPLPFISKGGSAIVGSLLCVALLLNISRFRKRARVAK